MSKLGNDQVYSNEDISREIKSILSEVLKLSVDSIDDEKSLIELGLSSLSAVELTEKLNQISIHVLLASDLYEIKSISQLVTLVVEGVRPKGLVNNWLLPLNDAPDHVVKMICFPDLGKLTI
jgi:acyl carrier protein